MSTVTDAGRLAVTLAQERAVRRWHGYVRRQPLARLALRAGRDDPYAIYEQLRAAGPLVRERDMWVTTGHAVANQVLRDRRFGVRPADDPTPGPGELDLSFLDRDEPDHGRLRRLAAPAFTPRAVSTYRAQVEATTRALLADLERGTADRAGADLVAGFAAPLPIAVITGLLGIADADAADFAEYGVVLGDALDGIRSLRHAAALQAAGQRIVRIFDALIEDRRVAPRDDLVSHLVTDADPPLTAAELEAMCGLLLLAGFETTVNLIGNAVLALMAHPEQWQALCADPSLAPRAVEEVLRFDPPVQRTYRVAHQAVEVAGVRIEAGEWVVVLIGAAGRDPMVYEDPQRFDITREKPFEHLAFSGGAHYCLGAPLARLEAHVALAALARQVPDLALAGRPTRRPSRLIRGPAALPVRLGRHRDDHLGDLPVGDQQPHLSG